MFQIKEQNRTPKKVVNKKETSHLLLDVSFKTLVVRMLTELSENFNSIKKDQSEMKDTLTKMKNNLQETNSKLDEAKNQISNLEYKEAIKYSIRKAKRALDGMPQWIECQPVNQRVTSSNLSGYLPGLQARSPVGGAQEATTH